MWLIFGSETFLVNPSEGKWFWKSSFNWDLAGYKICLIVGRKSAWDLGLGADEFYFILMTGS
jgi:hypothetical protein